MNPLFFKCRLNQITNYNIYSNYACNTKSNTFQNINQFWG